jgi:hypothetical protein
MTVRRFLPLAFMAALALGAGTARATTTNPVATCLKEATKTSRICLRDAAEANQTATDACLNRNHACVEVCRANRCDCAEGTGLEDAVRTCNDALDAGRRQCRTSYASGTPERDACVDQVQVTAFVCRDDAREAAKAAVQLCRTDFRACGRACGPPDPLDPVNVKQCRLDAKAAKTAAKAVCREDFQLAKDTCKNRDHDCVELCRVTRHACATPVLDALEGAKDACRATRDAAVADCRSQFADGTPELDACIDLAQVVAFRCRDDARELAWPDLEACRQGFRTCAQACPAPPVP